MSSSDSDCTSSDDEYSKTLDIVVRHGKIVQHVLSASRVFSTYYCNTYFNKSDRRQPEVTGYDWVIKCLNNPRACYKMYRLNRSVFDSLHETLVSHYGLKSTCGMSSVESLGMFLWILGGPQSVTQVENRFERSTETIHRKFSEVLDCVFRLGADIIKPKDAQFTQIHPRLEDSRFYPYFNGCIGAIDGTHVPVIVPTSKTESHIGQHRYTSQNVLAICDFDMRFTFVVAGWPGSAHDTTVFNDALERYASLSCFLLKENITLLIRDILTGRVFGLHTRVRHHLNEFRQGAGLRNKKEKFNFFHSSIRNVIERSFDVLKMKWRILGQLPRYSERKQTQIIIACMALHNFIRESALADDLFDLCDQDEDFVLGDDEPPLSSQTTTPGMEESDMNTFRDSIANGLMDMNG